jgi:hypothetical protein
MLLAGREPKQAPDRALLVGSVAVEESLGHLDVTGIAIRVKRL